MFTERAESHLQGFVFHIANSYWVVVGSVPDLVGIRVTIRAVETLRFERRGSVRYRGQSIRPSSAFNQ